MNATAVLVLRIAIAALGVAALRRWVLGDGTEALFQTMMAAIGLCLLLLPRALYAAAAEWVGWVRAAAWAPEEGRWHAFRGHPVAIREHDGDLWIRWADVLAGWQSPLAIEPGLRELPGEGDGFARVSLALRAMHASSTMPSPRQAQFMFWLEREVMAAWKRKRQSS